MSISLLFDACREQNKWRERFADLKVEPEVAENETPFLGVYDKETKACYQDPFDSANPVNHFFLMNFACQSGNFTDAKSLYADSYINFCEQKLRSNEGCVKFPYDFDTHPVFEWAN